MEIAEAFVTIRPRTDGFAGQLTNEVGRDVDRVGTQAGQRFGSKFGASLKGMGSSISGALGAAAGLTGLVMGFRAVITEAEDAERVGRQTEAVIRSTGSAAGVTADHLGDLAGRLSKIAAVDDEVIQSAGNVLLTFKNVRNEVGAGNAVFDETLSLALDMSAALGMDLQSAVMQLGKAVNDPVTGLSRLTRAGVDFTQQQKDQIAALVESGNTLEAQKIILAEVEAQFGDSAEANATGLARLEVAFGNLMETIGSAPPVQGWFDWFVEGIENPLKRLESYATSGPIPAIWETLNPPDDTGSALGDAIGDIADEAREAQAAVGGFEGSLEELTDEIKQHLELAYALPEAQRGLAESFKQLFEAAAGDDPAEIAAGLQGVAEAFGAVLSAGGDPLGSLEIAMSSLRRFRDSGAITAEEFEGLADVLRGMPGVREALEFRAEARTEEAGSQVEAFRHQIETLPNGRTTKFQAETEEARRRAEGLDETVRTVPDGRITNFATAGTGSAIANALAVRDAVRSVPTDIRITFGAVTAGLDAAAAAIRNAKAAAEERTPAGDLVGAFGPTVDIADTAPAGILALAATRAATGGPSVARVYLDRQVLAEAMFDTDRRMALAEGYEP